MKIYKCINIKRMYCLLFPVFLMSAACAFFFSRDETAADETVPLPVIMYHSICNGISNEYTVTPQQVESDLAALKANGYTSVTAQQLVDFTAGCGKLPEKPVLITLDDGFYNNLLNLLPLLEKYDMYAVIAVVGRYTDEIAAADPHVERYSYLTWEDCRKLADSGRIELADHTYDMHSLNNGRKGCGKNDGEDEESYRAAIMADIGRAQEEISGNTGIEPFIFAYPFGIVSRESIPVMRELGFSVTLTCREKVNIISHDPDCLIGLGRFNRSGYISTDELIERISLAK